MKTRLEDLLRKINPDYRIEWLNDNEARFEIEKRDKYIKAKAIISKSENLLFDDVVSNYSSSYLLKKLRQNSNEINMSASSYANGIRFNVFATKGDKVTVLYSSIFDGLKVGSKTNLTASTRYYQINNGPIECNPIDNLKQDFSAVVTAIFSSKCASGNQLSNYIEFKL